MLSHLSLPTEVGKIYDVINTMFINDKCAVRIEQIETDPFHQSRDGETLFHTSTDELASQWNNQMPLVLVSPMLK